jgi:hypothetical protein
VTAISPDKAMPIAQKSVGMVFMLLSGSRVSWQESNGRREE